VESSTTYEFGFKNARLKKKAWFTGTWWIFPRPVYFASNWKIQNSVFHMSWWVFPRPMEFASEDQAQNSVIHKWLVDFSSRNLKIMWTNKYLKGKK